MKIYLLLLLLLLPVVSAQDAQTIYDAESLSLEIEVRGAYTLVPEGSNARIETVNANLSLFPKDLPSQQTSVIQISPKARREGDVYIFEWDSPEMGEQEFILQSRVVTQRERGKVTQKINFPIEVSEELLEYTKPTITIDSDDPEIIKLASQLAQGEDDMYVVVHKLAAWSQQNIEYNLSTLTADVSQKSSWVLENRRGVCDELTSLFIALNRALGIPARFVTGLSYTNSELFPENWGLHGWAEVYFPGVGWVPFDVTYGQYGFVDASHIIFEQKIDSGPSHTTYHWSGVDTKLVTQKLQHETKLIQTTPISGSDISLNAEVFSQEVGFGSYELVEVNVKNLRNYYVSSTIEIAHTLQTQIIGESLQEVVLEPNQESQVYFIIKVDKDLKQGFIYDFPIVVYSELNHSSTTHLKATRRGTVYSLEEIRNLIPTFEKKGSANLKISCQQAEPEYYDYDEVQISCFLTNTGDKYIEDLEVCSENICELTDIGITHSVTKIFDLGQMNAGKRRVLITAKNSEINQADEIEIDIIETPKIDVNVTSYQQSIKYDDPLSIEIRVVPTSSSSPESISVNLKSGNVDQTWSNLENPDRANVLIYNAEGNILKPGENVFDLRVEYTDSNGNEYVDEQKFSVNLDDVTLFQRIMISLYGIGVFISRIL